MGGKSRTVRKRGWRWALPQWRWEQLLAVDALPCSEMKQLHAQVEKMMRAGDEPNDEAEALARSQHRRRPPPPSHRC